MNSHGVRLFMHYYTEAVGELGAEPESVIALRDMAERHAWTAGDYVSLAVLDEAICEFYGLTEEGFAEWR